MIFIALIWYYNISAVTLVSSRLQAGPSIKLNGFEQVKHVLSNPLRFMYITAKSAIKGSWFDGTIGILGYNFVALPVIVISYLAIMLSWATIFSDKVKKNLSQNIKKGCLFLGVGVKSGGSIILALYIDSNTVGASSIGGVQGRYFIPILPFFLYGLRKVIPIRLHMPPKRATLLFTISAIVCLAFTVAWYYKYTYSLPLV